MAAIQLQISDSFQKSGGRLSKEERVRLFDLFGKLQEDPESPGLNLERVKRARDPNLWSARVSQDIRAILWRSGPLVLLLYAGHHNDAYAWAARHRIEGDRRF